MVYIYRDSYLSPLWLQFVYDVYKLLNKIETTGVFDSVLELNNADERSGDKQTL